MTFIVSLAVTLLGVFFFRLGMNVKKYGFAKALELGWGEDQES